MFVFLFRAAAIAALICAFPVFAQAAEPYRIDLHDGSSLIGEIVERTDSEIVIKMTNGPTLTLSMANVSNITGGSRPQGNVLRLSGSTTIGGELARDLARAFLRSQISDPDDERIELAEQDNVDHPNSVLISLRDESRAFFQAVEITAEGSSTGFADLLEGEADFAMASRPVSKKEWQSFLDRYGVDMRSSDAEYVIGIDAIEIIVNPLNGLSALSRSGIAEVYRKQLDTWNDFPIRASGLDDAVVTLGRDENSATADSFERIVMGDATPIYDFIMGGADEVAAAVQARPAAIGFVGIGNAQGNRPLAINECGIDYQPDSFLVSAEDHPLSRRLYLYRNPNGDSPFSTAFSDFVLSDGPGAGQSIVDRYFVGLELREADEDVTAWRLQITGNQPTQTPGLREQFRSRIGAARRLSATFRFALGGTSLDSRGQRDLRAVVDKVQREAIAPERVLIFGFADSLGSEQVNAELSRKRAEVIANELRRRGVGVPQENVLGIGEEAPIGCNNRPDGSRDEAGASRNRRIEIWVNYDGTDRQTTGVGGQLEPAASARSTVDGATRPISQPGRIDTTTGDQRSQPRSPLM